MSVIPLGNKNEAYNYAIKLLESKRPLQIPMFSSCTAHLVGYAFWQVGKKEEAKSYFNQCIEFYLEDIELNRWASQVKWTHYSLAGIYAFLGDKEKAYQYLDEFNEMKIHLPELRDKIKYDPLFNSIREEERFQKILRDVEDRYQKEHERVKAWLEEEGML